MAPEVRKVETEVARIARAQHGVVTRGQLLGAGISDDQIKHRMRIGALRRVHRGVYRLGHEAPSLEASYLAAVLAAGTGALLGGRAAAHLFGLIRRAAPPEVTTPTERRLEGVLTTRSVRLDPRDATTWRGIPVTTVARTLVDLAAELDEAELAGPATRPGCATARRRSRSRRCSRGGPTRRARPSCGGLRGEVHVTLSKLERRFLELLRQAGLVLPVTNRPAGGGGSTAAGPSSGSPLSSTGIATTTRGTRGSRTGGASARPAPAGTSSAATPQATSSSIRGSWSGEPMTPPERGR